MPIAKAAQNRQIELSLSATVEVVVRGNPIYTTLQNEKVYIEYDGMERGITQDLFAQGIVEQDIILAFLADIHLTVARSLGYY